MNSAPTGATNPAAGVIATNPATQPDATPSTLGLPRCHHSTNIHASVAAAEAMCVFTNAVPANPFAPSALPPLNPNQPNHRMPAAKDRQRHVVRFQLAVAAPRSQNQRRNQRGNARTDVHDRAARKIERAQVAEPAAHAPDPVANRIVNQRRPSSEKRTIAENFIRSATAPKMSAGVMIANIIW